MRDIVVIGIILGSTPLCFLNSYFGVLMWTWIAYFNPHRYCFGFAYNFPVAYAVAIPTLLGLILNRDRNRKVWSREFGLVVLLWTWFVITTLFAISNPDFAGHADDATTQLIAVSKILLMAGLTVFLVTSEKKLRWMVLVIAVSFGLVAVKGAIFGATTDGQFRVYGPPDSFIADNNDLGLALNMTLPILFYLGQAEKKRWLRLALKIAFIGGIVSVLLTYSRGALLGLAVVLACIGFKSRHKILSASVLVAVVFAVISFAPPAWMDRMGNFAEGNLDSSAMQRIVTWEFAWNFVKAYPITGGGFGVFPDINIFQRYVPEQLPGGFRSSGPHSIYFQMLGEQGFVGFGLFVALLISCQWTLWRIQRKARRVPNAAWLVPYCSMFQVGLLAYAVSGAFLGRAYFDLFYQLVACVCAVRLLYRYELRRTSEEPEQPQEELEGPDLEGPEFAQPVLS